MKHLLLVLIVSILCSAPTCADVDVPSLKTLPAAADPKTEPKPTEPSPADAPTEVTPIPESEKPTEDRVWAVMGVIASLCHGDTECLNDAFICYAKADPRLSVVNAKRMIGCVEKEEVSP